jgi:hypothetical protein
LHYTIKIFQIIDPLQFLDSSKLNGKYFPVFFIKKAAPPFQGNPAILHKDPKFSVPDSRQVWLFLEKNTKASYGMYYSGGGFNQAFSTFPFS